MRISVVQPAYGDLLVETEVVHAAMPEAEVVAAPYQRGAPLGPELAGADVVMLRDPVLGRAEIAQLARCRGIVRCGVGYNNVDVEAATERRIKVCNTPGYDTDEVSNHAIALYLALRRRLVTRNAAVRQGGWSFDDKEPISAVRTTVLGLIGYGKIARDVHRKMLAFGPLETLVFDPYVDDATLAAAGVRRASVDEICARATMISLHATMTAETHHILGAAQIARMRKDAIVINVGRGGLIDADALTGALAENRILGAGLDVFETEPPDVRTPLFSLPNVIVTDHCAWYSVQSIRHLRTLAAEEAVRLLRGEKPASWVNRWDK